MSNTGFHLDIGRVIAWSSRPKETPIRNDEYQRLVRRHRDDPEFAEAVEEVFLGAGLSLIVDDRDGFIVTANTDSMLRVTAGDIGKAFAEHRSVVGLIMLAIARNAFPDAAMLADSDRVGVFTVKSVVDALDRAAHEHAKSSDADAALDTTEIEAWRHWEALAPGKPNAQRRSANDRPGAVNRVCKFLAERGYLTERGTLDGGTWHTRPKLRHAVADLTADSDLYRQVNNLAESLETPDDRH